MISLGLSHFLQILTSILLLTQSFSEDDRKIYIVYMGSNPKGMESTKLLHTSMVQSVLGRKFAPEALLHNYKSFNGFVARLTEEEAEKMKGMGGVVSVIPNRANKVQTSRSWDFLGFPENVERSPIESDLIVGVIDSGIWADSYSFYDQGYDPPPPGWRGACYDFNCNNKIIGAKYFRISGEFDDGDIINPTDTSGHGSHCASTAAGNLVWDRSLYGLGLGTVRGGVPSARIAVYKVCWTETCDDADILAGFDEALSDGVDVISVSVGPSKPIYLDYTEDVFAIGSFHAMKEGILTSKSADNLGPDPYSMSNVAPWFISVAASTIDRKFVTDLQLGNNWIFKGISVNTFDPTSYYQLIYGGDAPNITGGYNSSVSRYCPEYSLDVALVKGKIVLCEENTNPVSLGFVSGAAGVIIAMSNPLVDANVFALPAIQISHDDGSLVYDYLKSTRNPTATIYKSYEGIDSFAPYIAPFSSRGPNKVTRDILKPDIAAPGVDILAAWSPISPISNVKGDMRVSYYNIISGTSMACPHVTAAAVYIKSFHPHWSPAAIKSALMTTATPLSSELNEDAEFAYGAGEINPIRAVYPGLVYDANELDYVKFLCGQGYDGEDLQLITGDYIVCPPANNESVWDLNLPSFALSTDRATYTKATFSRTVTNVGCATSWYKATIINPYPNALNIQVEPDLLVFLYLGETRSFTLTIEGSIDVDIVSSSLIWDDGTFQVRSPVVVYVPP